MFKEDGNVIHFAAPKGTSPQKKSLLSINGWIRVLQHPGNDRLEFLSSLNTISSTYVVLSLPAVAPIDKYMLSSRIRTLQYFRHIRQWRRQGTHRTCPWYTQPARS